MSQLVGILNPTPDSFSDGGEYFQPEAALSHARELFKAGAAIVDVGAEATNPIVEPISSQEELRRLELILGPLLDEFPGRISLDTYHVETARHALRLGKIIINDVTTFRDPEMIRLAAAEGVRCIVSHLPFDAPNIKWAHDHPTIDSIYTVRDELLQRHDEMVEAGIDPKKIILDPGIGFGKTVATNRNLLTFAELVPDKTVMIGYSHKRFLGDNRHEIAPNLRAGRIATRAGAKYLRVHDVAAHAADLEITPS